MATAPRRALTLAASFEAAAGSSAGLSSVEAARRLRAAGPNLIAGESGARPIATLVAQFRSPMIIILLAAAALTFAIGDANEAAIIAAIVLASSGLGFFQEFSAGVAVQKLRQRLAVGSTVLRDGATVSISAAGVVPGDVVELSAGSLVPADGVLIEARDLQADEAALTGESFPVAKQALSVTGTSDEGSRVYMGTSVRSGYGKALILQTGRQTEFAGIVGDAARQPPETSFAKGIRAFGVLMTQIMLVLLALVFPINFLLGRPLLESLLFSTALAVGLTPELLPAIVTVTLARGAQQLAKTGVLVRRLASIEDLGAMNVLCTDKTGTLTLGEVSLDRATDADGETSALTLEWALANARLQTGLPNTLDLAVLKSTGAGGESYARIDEVPYDFERKRLSVMVRNAAVTTLICKGAVDSVLSVCASILRKGQSRPLSDEERNTEAKRLAYWGAQGIRVLAVATRDMGDLASCARADEAELTLVGYLLFSDPLKPGIATTVAELARAGVRLKIVSGDNRYVTAHVAAQAGLAADRVVTGQEISGLSHRALSRLCDGVNLFAELTPDQKERIIRAVRASKNVVGYLGDGINDAPALRSADVGISVDNAVDAAKEAAAVVLLRQDLKVLLDGIIIGRRAFANTLKYIAITTSANVGNMISMAVASLFLPFLPMLAKQILLNNLLTDLPLMAISTDRVDEESTAGPGRWNLGGLLRSMLLFGALSSLFDGVAFAVLLGFFHASAAVFQTGWFVFSLATEVVVIAVMRTRRPILASAPSPLLVSIGLVILGLGVLLPYLPVVGSEAGLVRLQPSLLVALAAVVVAYVIAAEVVKRVARTTIGGNRPRVPGSMRI